jgi:uncharacterized protein YutD
VSKSEWDSFLDEFTNLTQKYELIVAQLNLTRTRIEGLNEKTQQQIATSGEALRQIEVAVERLCDETEDELNEQD